MIENIEALKPDGYNVSNRKKKKKTITKLPFIIKNTGTIFSKIPIKIEKENKVLKHYGIQNQNWGDRNGPPYPLSPEVHNAVVSGIDSPGSLYKQVKSSYENHIRKSNNPKTISRHLKLFTTQELQDKINRIEKEKKIKELASTKKQQEKGYNFVKDVAEKTGKVMASKLSAKVANSFFKERST